MNPTGIELMEGRTAWRRLLADIEQEKHAIWLAQYVVRLARFESAGNTGAPWPVVTDALLAAPARGVTCRMLLPSPDAAGSIGSLDAASRARLRNAGWEIRVATGKGLLHAKAWLFGSRAVWLGSHNLTAASWTTTIDASWRNCGALQITTLQNWFIGHWRTGVAR